MSKQPQRQDTDNCVVTLIPRDFWERWKLENADSELLKAGLIREANVDDEA